MIENKLNGESFDIVEDNISKLKELFPEIVTSDNEVDIGALVDIFALYFICMQMQSGSRK